MAMKEGPKSLITSVKFGVLNKESCVVMILTNAG